MKKFIIILFISLAAAFCIKLGIQGRGGEELGSDDRQPLSTDMKGAVMQKLEVEQSEEYQLCGAGGNEAASAKKALLSLGSESQDPRACLKIHFRHLHVPLCGIFAPNSGYIAHYAPFIRSKSPTNCDAQLSESNFQTRSRAYSLAVNITEPDALAKSCSSLSEAAWQERALWLMEFKTVQDHREWFLGYKELLERQAGILGTPASIYDCFNEQELDRLFRVVQAEIGDEYSFDQKCNVASVIFNRLKHPEFGGTLEAVLSPGQFSTVKNGRYLRAEVSQETILACEYSFMIGDTTGGCLFFDSNGVLKYSFVFNDGAHNFYTLPSKKR